MGLNISALTYLQIGVKTDQRLKFWLLVYHPTNTL